MSVRLGPSSNLPTINFNPRPVFLARNLRIMSEPRLIGEKHLKMHVSGPAGRPLETIWWNGAGAEQTVAVTNGITMAYTIEANRWDGDTFLQLSVQEVRAESLPI